MVSAVLGSFNKESEDKQMNNATIVARATKNFEANQTGKQGTGTVACDRPYPYNKDREGNKVTDFLNIKIIGENQVERAVQYIKKGTKIVIRGSVFRDTWKDNDGNWKEFNYIMVQEWEFAESKGTNGTDSNAPANNADKDGFMNIPDGIEESLPFN